MTDPASLQSLHDQITDALAELRGARTIYDHNPCHETAHVVDLCEWRLDVLLARQWAAQQVTA